MVVARAAVRVFDSATHPPTDSPSFIASDLQPSPSKRVVQDNPHEESHAHVPHGKGGHDEHHVEIGLLVSDVLHNDGQFRAGEEQDDAQDRVGEYFKENGDGIAEKQSYENEDTSKYYESPTGLRSEAHMPGPLRDTWGCRRKGEKPGS
jgi:hypothetical protein